MQSAFTRDVHSFVVDNFLLGSGDILNDDASFLEEGIIDSTGILELVAFLEETYGIEVTDDEVSPENLDTVNRVSSYLARKLNGHAAALVGRSADPAV